MKSPRAKVCFTYNQSCPLIAIITTCDFPTDFNGIESKKQARKRLIASAIILSHVIETNTKLISRNTDYRCSWFCSNCNQDFNDITNTIKIAIIQCVCTERIALMQSRLHTSTQVLSAGTTERAKTNLSSLVTEPLFKFA